MIIVLFSTIFGCSQPPPPSCADDADYACFRGVFRTLLGGSVEGMKLCVPELTDIPCVTTDEDGGWKIPGLPKDTDVYITAEHPDFVSTVFPQNTSFDWYEWYKVAMPAWVMEQNAGNLDLEIDMNKGHLIFLVWEGLNIDGEDTPLVEGVQASLSPASDNVFYANGFGLASDNMTATGSSGSGGAVNLNPGRVNLTLNAPAGKCLEHSFSFLFNTDNTIPVPIREGFTTAIDVICPVE